MVIENKTTAEILYLDFSCRAKSFFVKILAVHLYPFSQNNSLTCFGVISISSQNVAAHSLRLVFRKTNQSCLTYQSLMAWQQGGWAICLNDGCSFQLCGCKCGVPMRPPPLLHPAFPSTGQFLIRILFQKAVDGSLQFFQRMIQCCFGFAQMFDFGFGKCFGSLRQCGFDFGTHLLNVLIRCNALLLQVFAVCIQYMTDG